MLEKFTLNYNGHRIKTNKGLVQGSTLSPLPFNLFINDLLNALKSKQIMTRAYADDIECMEQTIEAIQIMNEWTEANKMRINPTKSGILRILNRSRKAKGIPNSLDIPEVTSYKYLGVEINQTIGLNEHIKILRQTEEKLMKGINILKPSLVSTESRFMVYKIIIRAKLCDALYIIWHHNQKFINKWEGIIYRLLKRLFWIRGNVSIANLYRTLRTEPIEKQIERMIKRLEGKPTEQQIFSKNVEKLSLKMIKLEIGWLFNPRATNPKCKWSSLINNSHIIKDWPKTRIWRIKWNNKSRAINGRKITDNFLNEMLIDKADAQLINLMNEAVEESTQIYLE